jgi:short-subunit dehydrogenase
MVTEVCGPFAGKVAVVTGASSGIGWSLGKVLAQEGCKVGLIARRQEPLEALVGEIHQAGGTALAATADVGERAQTQSAFGKIRDALGPVDLVVANAGVGMPTLLDPVNIDHVEQMIRINVMGVIYTIEAALPDMLRRRQGHLAAVSSLAAYKGMPGESAYCASKAAISSYLEGLRIHLRDRGVTVTTLCPGFVKTPMTEINNFHMPFLLDADTAARRMVNALRRRRKVYNFPWQASLLVKLTRWLPDWIVARTMQSYNENPPMPK